MTKTQKILIGNGILTDEEASILIQQNGCVAYYKNIPPSLLNKAKMENWILPYVYTETWEEPNPIV